MNSNSGSTTLKMAFDVESQIGVIKPTGFWDPIGLAKDIDQETFDKYRTAELKHGRISQLAVVGFLAAEALRFPGSIGGVNFADIPNSVGALGVLPAAGWAQIGMSIGFWELFGWKQVENSTPGDFDFKGEIVCVCVITMLSNSLTHSFPLSLSSLSHTHTHTHTQALKNSNLKTS